MVKTNINTLLLASTMKSVCSITPLLISGSLSRTTTLPWVVNGFRKFSLSPSTMARHPRPRMDESGFDQIPTSQFAKENAKLSLRTYMWGNAQTGAVGVAEYPRPQSESGKKQPVLRKHHPIRLPFCELFSIRFKQVSCGYGFTLFLTVEPDMQNHQVFVTGVNTDSQLGFHSRKRNDKSMKIILSPIGLDLPLRNRKSKILQVAAGRAHSLILTEEGCFSLGNNAYGQCGRPILEKEDYSTNSTINRIRDLPDDIVKIHCSQDTSYFLTSQGQVYSCGWGADGQTGNGTYDTSHKPVLAKGDIAGEHIVQISSAGDCVMALNDKGDAFGWGNSEYRQLSMVTKSPQTPDPQYLPFHNLVGKIKHISAGGTVCGLINETGQAFVWGFGLLGKGPDVQQLDYPSLMPPGLFEATDFEESNPLKSITCGLMHFAVLSERGDLFTWGANHFGQLGLSRLAKDMQYFPLRVSIPARVMQISLGVDHSGAICKANI